MRIVSLLPSTTEILFAIGAGPDVVGVTHECDYPPQAKTRPVLTASALPQIESPSEIHRHVSANVHNGSSLYELDSALLERLQPDLIVTQELCEVCAVSYHIVDRAVRRLQGDPRIVSFEPETLDDVFSTIETLGRLSGREEGAQQLAAELRAQRDAMRRDRPSSRPRVLLLEWSDPPMSAGHWLPELIELAGGDAVLADSGRKSRVLGWDEIAAADPDAIVVSPCGFDAERAAVAVAAIDAPQWHALRAVRAGAVLAVDGNQYFSRPGPRLLEGAQTVARWLHATPAGRT